ncbi:MAG: hypothetical protein IAE97_08675 [Chthoniobacterales bacterium]|nr:hypothetical protein [Chthoniobacterales bacterium]
MTKAHRKHRERELTRIRRALEKLQAPRLQMALIVALTGGIGFLASVTLLHVGVDSMWIRYPASVVIAYLGFLFLLWCWLRSRGDRLLEVLNPVDVILNSGVPGLPHSKAGTLTAGGGEFGGAGASGTWNGTPANGAPLPSADAPSLDLPDIGDAVDLDALALVLLAVVLLTAALFAAFWFIWAAPVLLAELLLDAALAAGLYRRLRGVRGRHWLRTAIRRTAWPFAAAAAMFGLIGVLFQISTPGAVTVGQVVDHVAEHFSDDTP